MPNMGKRGYHCPECGVELHDHDLDAHAELHWPSSTDPRYMGKEALARRAVVIAGGERRGAPA